MHWRAGRQRQRPRDGRHVWAFDGRAGYWPCIRALFAKFDFGPVFIELCLAPEAPPWWKGV